MRVEAYSVESFVVYDAPKLDPITVHVRDDGPGSGGMSIEVFGMAWTAYWGATGNQRIRDFLRGCDAGYVTTKFIPNGRRTSKHEQAYLLRIVGSVLKALKIQTPSLAASDSPTSAATGSPESESVGRAAMQEKP